MPTPLHHADRHRKRTPFTRPEQELEQDEERDRGADPDPERARPAVAALEAGGEDEVQRHRGVEAENAAQGDEGDDRPEERGDAPELDVREPDHVAPLAVPDDPLLSFEELADRL